MAARSVGSASSSSAASGRVSSGPASSGPVLAIHDLDVRYGQAHVLQAISLAFDHGVLAIVGRNGMGKTTLCNAITGLLPGSGSARAVASGSIRVDGRELLGLTPNRITGAGVAYVPQGRRVWPSLTVDEHLRLVAGRRRGGWDVDRVYQTFPRLAERRRNGGAQLSGGEQQMLAIGRALLLKPRLLVMDEPTEGLAPVIVQQVATMLKTLAMEGDIAVLLVEQNLGVAIDVADRVIVMVNGRIASDLSAAALAADTGLQQRLLGVRSGPEGGEGTEAGAAAEAGAFSGSGSGSGAGAGAGQGIDQDPIADHLPAPVGIGAAVPSSTPRLGPSAPPAGHWPAGAAIGQPVFTVRRAGDAATPGSESRAEAAVAAPRPVRAITRWNAADPRTTPGDRLVGPTAAPPSLLASEPRDHLIARRAATAADAPTPSAAATETARRGREARVIDLPVSATTARAAYIAGTFDTKGRELFFLRNCLEKLGLRTVTVDLSTSGKPSPAMVHPREVARHHHGGEAAVFTGDRGQAVDAMAEAFARYIQTRRDLGGLLSAGGSGGTALATAAMRSLPVGVPKLMVSTVASGDVAPYVGPTDICMMYSVTDVSGINRISEQVLSNAAHALAGMIRHRRPPDVRDTRPAIALTMFGVTTTTVQAVSRELEARYDCLTFHATGTGGRSMEKLVDSGLITAALDITTTEVCDELFGGVLPGGPDRFGAFARTGIPWVGSCGALDMINFWAIDTVPERYRGRNLYRHNPNVTLMRTTADECRQIGAWIAERINRMTGPVRFLIPEGGVSALDAPGQPFHDPEVDRALFEALVAGMRITADHRLERLPWHINDPRFSDALVAALEEVLAGDRDASPAPALRLAANRGRALSASPSGPPLR